MTEDTTIPTPSTPVFQPDSMVLTGPIAIRASHLTGYAGLGAFVKFEDDYAQEINFMNSAGTSNFYALVHYLPQKPTPQSYGSFYLSNGNNQCDQHYPNCPVGTHNVFSLDDASNTLGWGQYLTHNFEGPTNFWSQAPMVTQPCTVSNLAPGYTPVDGQRGYVNDALTGGWRDQAIGGGNIHTPVFYDGGTGVWRVG